MKQDYCRLHLHKSFVLTDIAFIPWAVGHSMEVLKAMDNKILVGD